VTRPASGASKLAAARCRQAWNWFAIADGVAPGGAAGARIAGASVLAAPGVVCSVGEGLASVLGFATGGFSTFFSIFGFSIGLGAGFTSSTGATGSISGGGGGSGSASYSGGGSVSSGGGSSAGIGASSMTCCSSTGCSAALNVNVTTAPSRSA
jgi:hypothetical protein